MAIANDDMTVFFCALLQAVALEKELLLVKEELIKAKLSLSFESEDNQSITNSGM